MSRRVPAAWPVVAALLMICALLPARAFAQSKAPKLIAPSAILVEQATGDVVVAKNADERRPIASTTKMMTALLALERLSLDDVLVQAPYDAAPAESLGGFRAGEKVTVRDELRALLLASANDAANTLAVRISGSRARFVRDMNTRAKALGLDDTSFANPIGLDDPDNYSTAADLVKLALVLRTKPFFRETTDLKRITIRSGAMPRTFENRNSLVQTVPAVNGVKTGHTTKAGYILVGSATKNGVTVVSAVLADPSEAARNADSQALLEYGLSRYVRRTALSARQGFGRARLRYRDSSVALVAARKVVRTARRGERFEVQVTGAPAELDGPLAQGVRVGTIVVRQRGEVVDRVPLVIARAVTEASAVDRLKDFANRPRTILFAVIFVAGSLILVVLRTRSARERPAGEPEAAPPG